MKIFKKMISMLTALLVTVSMFAFAAFAATQTGTVHVSSYLNVRSAANTGAPIVGKLLNGEQVSILGSSNGWYRISYNGETAWVSGQYITVSSGQTQTGTVNVSSTSYLNVRSAASTQATIVGKLSKGEQVTILGESDGWYQISYNGEIAWVYGQYISVSSDLAQIVVDAANSAIGVTYVFAGATMSGMDCSGLVVYSYAKAGITLPHSSAQQATYGVAVSEANLQPGDLVFFDTDGGLNNINHVGIYIGDNNFISAQSGAGIVKVASLSNSYWSARYMTARRIINA
ncbi:MAG TPA: SH3 domain-containing protein [Oscillospiraceae bacterium]|nr:SH3 domain-containing protein [Oscillospiraceae bacterium]HPF55024.1 SH3 domain-containing protein [Clostridiales bacterium]HPK35806.1 SH3 domain-containing protein [Oscillospiraceae bacterium]HPR75426.1 SH3 domain-containing protein [Oscillospiraceae bacterium]